MYQVIIHNKAAKYLKKLSKILQNKIKQDLIKLANNPFAVTSIKPMAGPYRGYYRKRIGDIRIIFWVDTLNQKIYVNNIGHRGSIY